MIRIQRGTTATLSKTFYEDGTAVNPGTVTLTITASDGTPVVTGAATTGSGTAARTYALTAEQTALLDTWTLSWVSTGKGTLTDECEIAGGYLFALTDLAAVKVGQSSTIGTTYTTQQMVNVRLLVEQALEDACGVAFVPRYRIDTIRTRGSLMLDRPKVTALRTIAVNGTAGDASAYDFDPSGVVYGTFYRGSTVTVGYEHGWTSPPARISNAALLLARRWLIDGPADDRATSLTVEGTGTFSLVTPGMRGVMFDIPEVNAAVQQYSMAALVA